MLFFQNLLRKEVTLTPPILSSIFLWSLNMCFISSNNGVAAEIPTYKGFGLLECEENACHDILVHNLFTYLYLKDCSRLGRINTKLTLMANEQEFLKRKIYLEKTFNPHDWNKFYNLKVEDELEAWQSLPDTIADTFKSSCQIVPNKNFAKTHVFVWIPKGMSINLFQKILKKRLPNNPKGFNEVFDGILEKYGDITTEKGEWIIMPKEILPTSACKKFSFQKNMVRQLNKNYGTNYTFPKVLEAIICITSMYFKSKIKMLPKQYTRCHENIDVDNHGKTYRLIVGYSSTGLILHHGQFDNDKIGIAPTRKLNA